MQGDSKVASAYAVTPEPARRGEPEAFLADDTTQSAARSLIFLTGSTSVIGFVDARERTLGTPTQAPAAQPSTFRPMAPDPRRQLDDVATLRELLT